MPKYKITETGYDDTTIRQAIENIKDKYTADNYNMFFHNCQDFVENVRQEYKRIKEGKNNE